MMKRLAAAAAAFTLTLGISLSAASPARAEYWADCGNWGEVVCLWPHANFGSPVWRQTPAQVDYCRSLVGTGWNNVTTTAANNTSGHYLLELWAESNCTGKKWQVQSGYTANFAGSADDNTVSAVRVIAL